MTTLSAILAISHCYFSRDSKIQNSNRDKQRRTAEHLELVLRRRRRLRAWLSGGRSAISYACWLATVIFVVATRFDSRTVSFLRVVLAWGIKVALLVVAVAEMILLSQ